MDHLRKHKSLAPTQNQIDSKWYTNNFLENSITWISFVCLFFSAYIPFFFFPRLTIASFIFLLRFATATLCIVDDSLYVKKLFNTYSSVVSSSWTSHAFPPEYMYKIRILFFLLSESL